jgi:hypothetical protein
MSVGVMEDYKLRDHAPLTTIEEITRLSQQ